MAEDLNKVEERWQSRRLFLPERRRRWGRLVILLVILLLGLAANEAGGVDWVYQWLEVGAAGLS